MGGSTAAVLGSDSGSALPPVVPAVHVEKRVEHDANGLALCNSAVWGQKCRYMNRTGTCGFSHAVPTAILDKYVATPLRHPILLLAPSHTQVLCVHARPKRDGQCEAFNHNHIHNHTHARRCLAHSHTHMHTHIVNTHTRTRTRTRASLRHAECTPAHARPCPPRVI